MNSIYIRLIVFSAIFPLPNYVAAQTEASDDSAISEARSVVLEAHGEDGTELPAEGGRASIEGTPGDGIRDSFNFAVLVVDSRDDEGAGVLALTVMALDDETADERFPDVDFEDVEYSLESGVATITGRIDLSYDTEVGQVLRFTGSVNGVRAKFEKDLTVPCVCPLAGRWRARNNPGTMVCTGAFNRTLPLAASVQTGTLEVSDDCETLHVTNFDVAYADVFLDQVVPGECSYKGKAQNIPNELDNTFEMFVRKEDRMEGNVTMQIEQSGATCILSRTFEVDYNE